MTITAPAREIFDDARHLYQSAIERLEAGDVRDAAEKAWCAYVEGHKRVDSYQDWGRASEDTGNQPVVRCHC